MEGILNLSMKDMIDTKYGLSLSTKELNYMYNLAAKKCQVGDYNNALNIFQFLTIYDTGNVFYTKAAAGCMQSLEKYQEAYDLYQTAFMLDSKNNPDCLFYMAYCAIKQNNYTDAVSLLESFLEKKSDNNLEKKANLLLEIAKKSDQKEKVQ